MTRTTLKGPLLWTAYTLVPIAGWGLLDGVPLGPIEAVTVFLIWWTWARSRTLMAGWLLVACLVIKVAAATLLLPQGFSASYFANSGFVPPIERSTEYRGTDATRIDQRLSFGGPGKPDLPLFFFDDIGRFNFYQGGPPHRARLPYSVVWEGYAWEEEGELARTFYLKGTAASGSLELDGAPIVTLDAGGGVAQAATLYAKGWRQLVVRAAGREEPARDFEAGFIDGEGVDRPFGTDPVFRSRASRRAVQIDGAIRMTSRAIDVGLLAVLAWLASVSLLSSVRRAWQEHGSPRWWALAALAAFVAACDAVRFAWPAAGRLTLQPGGDDSLTYQTYARDIVINGPLMLMGAEPGQGAAFYYQPLYSYVLALSHLVFGEEMFGFFFVQRLSMCFTLLGVCWIARRLDGSRASACAAVLSISLMYVWHRPWAAELWTEVVFVPLVVAWTCVLMRATDEDARYRTVVIAGVLGGLAVLGRSTLLLAVPLAVLLLVVTLPPRRRSFAAVMLLVMAAVISLATIRNVIVSGTIVPITTSFGINLFLGNEPPPGVPMHAPGGHALDRWVPGDERTRPVLEFARHAPGAFAANLWRKTLYAFGVFEPLVVGAGRSVLLILLWMAAAAGFIVAWRDGRREAPLPVPVRALPMAIAATMFAAIIIIFPSHSRLIMPGYIMLLPYAAVAAGRAVRLVLRTPAAGAASPTPTA